ncbi:MAG TPA: ABC transporter ATP-binding protein [Gemmatimonadaceae bacterium]|nr:ABC transporter ATP-binding protein [Gemmatimonadaceae bacterium]
MSSATMKWQLAGTASAPGECAALSGVTKCYGAVTALDDVTLRIGSGEVVALLGPNGAGKTTAVKLLLGLATATRGTVSLFGGDPRDSSSRVRTGAMLQIGKVPETLQVREHITLFSSYYPKPLPMRDVVAAAGLSGLERRRFGDLSGGQKQRALFALALCGNPDLLFLDEPTVGLDVEARLLLWERIRRLVAEGRTVLLTTHHLAEADALADRIVVIDRGTIIAEGTPSEIKQRAAGKRIRCVTSLPLAELSSLPGVREARADRNAVEIIVGAAEPVVRQLLARDPALSDLEVTGAALEDAFLALTRPDHDVNPSSRSLTVVTA